MKKSLLRNSLLVLLFSLSFSVININASHFNDNNKFYSLYGAGFNVASSNYKYYLTSEYFNSEETDRLDVFTGIDWNLSEKIIPFVFINYFYNTRLSSDYLRSGIGAYYVFNDLLFQHRISLAIVSETGRDKNMLSWRYKAWQDFGRIGFKYVLNIIEQDSSQRFECFYKMNKNIKLNYILNEFKSVRGTDISTMIGLDITF